MATASFGRISRTREYPLSREEASHSELTAGILNRIAGREVVRFSILKVVSRLPPSYEQPAPKPQPTKLLVRMKVTATGENSVSPTRNDFIDADHDLRDYFAHPSHATRTTLNGGTSVRTP